MSIKIYLHYEPLGQPDKVSKISVPKSWTTSKTVADVIELFAKGYNTKNPDTAIVTASVHLENSDREKIYSNVICGTVLGDHSDYYIRSGEHVQVRVVEEVAEGLVRCKNYGCNKYFDPESNAEDACFHHTGPPVFHDTLKYWSCCSDQKAFDFETFQEIRGCACGPHSTVNAGSVISASPNATVPGAGGSAAGGGSGSDAGPVIKSIADFNTSNPTAVSSEQSAVKTITARKSSRKADGLTATCQRKGCQQTFSLADNHSRACLHHAGSAVFHDAAKFWSCCPDKKKFDFEAFLAVPGCRRGCHDDGEVTEELLADVVTV